MQQVRYMMPWVIVAVVFVITIAGLMHAVRTSAQEVQIECRAAIIVDRSGSVGDIELETMIEQIKLLFRPTIGIHNDLIKLAFWSFSSSTDRTSNYNRPFHGYVSSMGSSPSFNARLDDLLSDDSQVSQRGATNYEQGFAYDRGIPNTFDNMEDIVAQTDILVFMTDGEPNTPGRGNNNSRAREAGRSAVLEHREDGKVIAGGIIGDADQASLNYVINGSDSNGTDIFNISSDYIDLREKLSEKIQQECSELLPPDDREYDLRPRVTAHDSVASGAGTARFSYSVRNTSDTSSSTPTNWSIKRVLVAPDKDVNGILFENPSYRDGMSCAELYNLVDQLPNNDCTVASGQRVFGPSDNDLTLDVPDNLEQVLMDDSWQVGTKLCFVLTVDKPTHRSTPVDRFSRADCTTIGKRPLVQVHGGDVMVGRYFDEVDSDARADIISNMTLKSNNRTYGSWAEFAVFTPGVVSGFATMSGLEGGFPSVSSETQGLWSSLTFANSDNEYGYFTESPGTLGSIPDVISAFTKYDLVDPGGNLNTRNSFDFSGAGKLSGLYRKDNGNLQLQQSDIVRGKTFILEVPNGSVTITGDINYENGSYSTINAIPQLVIIAENINVAESVRNIDAWLIARGDDSNGVINTCSIEGTLTSKVCNTLLRINGPVMARYLDLRRTAGAGAGEASDDPAEIINLPASTYLWSHSEGRSNVRIQTTHTIELPPYF